MPPVFSGGEITRITEQVCQVICLFIFFQACILLPARLGQIKFTRQVDCVTGKTDVKYRMFAWNF